MDPRVVRGRTVYSRNSGILAVYGSRRAAQRAAGSGSTGG